MSNIFVEKAKAKSNLTTTTNLAKTYKDTLNCNLNFFGKSGTISYSNLVSDFKEALAEDTDLAMRNLLNTRDIRGGKGIRENSRSLLRYLVANNPSLIIESNLILKFVELGRWDDIFEVLKSNNKQCSNFVINLLTTELSKDEPNKLLCKWLPRQNKSKIHQKTNFDILPKILAQRLKITPKEYRKLLVANTEVVETKMCSKDWKNITYSFVPSKAMKIYSEAFARHDTVGFSQYLEKVEKGEEEIKASTLWPHEVIGVGSSSYSVTTTKTQELQWKALPNFVTSGMNILPMVDLSGSMSCSSYGNYDCMDIAVALGLYLAQHNNSAYKDLILSFATNPSFVNVNKPTLEGNLRAIYKSDVGYSTDLEKAYNLVLNHAVKHKVPQADMPQMLVVFSDMQFNPSSGGKLHFKNIKKLFESNGYIAPKLVWWNLSTSYDNVPVKFDTDNNALVSGFSPSILKTLLSDQIESFTPLNVMLEELQQEKYNWK